MADRLTGRFRIPTLLAISFLAPLQIAAAPADPAAAAQNPEPLERGQQIARAVATVTGTAISPLFGVSVLGAYTYLKTPPAARASLPFYCSPYFWIPLAVLVTLVMLKDTVGSAAPVLKKPLDAIEILVVNKAALLFAVLPIVWHQAAAVSALHYPGGWLPSGILSTVYAAAPAAPAASGSVIPMALAVVTGTAIARSPSGLPATPSTYSPC